MTATRLCLVSVYAAAVTRDLFAIAQFLFNPGISGIRYCQSRNSGIEECGQDPGIELSYGKRNNFVS